MPASPSGQVAAALRTGKGKAPAPHLEAALLQARIQLGRHQLLRLLQPARHVGDVVPHAVGLQTRGPEPHGTAPMVDPERQVPYMPQ